MWIISAKPIRVFWVKHPKAVEPFQRWIKITERQNWKNFADQRQTFPDADQVGELTVFNVGGNKYRLIGAVHFNRGRIYVQAVPTHLEYNKRNWKP